MLHKNPNSHDLFLFAAISLYLIPISFVSDTLPFATLLSNGSSDGKFNRLIPIQRFNDWIFIWHTGRRWFHWLEIVVASNRPIRLIVSILVFVGKRIANRFSFDDFARLGNVFDIRRQGSHRLKSSNEFAASSWIMRHRDTTRCIIRVSSSLFASHELEWKQTVDASSLADAFP